MGVARSLWYWSRAILALLMDVAALLAFLPLLLLLGSGFYLILWSAWAADLVINFVDPEPVDLPKD